MTTRQHEIIEFLKSRDAMCPEKALSQDEIAEGVGLTTGHVSIVLNRAAERGLVRIERGYRHAEKVDGQKRVKLYWAVPNAHIEEVGKWKI